MAKSKGSTKTWKVEMLPEADKDVAGIIRFIYRREGSAMAREILKRFRKAKDQLRTLPERGRIVPELRRINILTFRELQIPPYRMMYQISEPENTVFIHIVVDGRRDLAELLQARLLKPDWRDDEDYAPH
ncbi:type II toxin-antitoxin system RelE/ParE family toxin [Desulfovibrio sp. OttesenSCG-928-F20]|nr:type II toxin-antitoxin system RelE/ParE family toxin [Desulfovibrio sp. OttesenSCG-928-F20]